MHTDDSPSLDMSKYNELKDILGDDIDELVDEYFSYSGEELDKLAVAVSDASSDSIFRIAHSMKSSSGNLGFQKMYLLCRQLELEARSDAINDSKAQLDAIQNEFAILRKLMNR